jgi:RNA polymerase sigma-70 factor (ECF subfamily)
MDNRTPDDSALIRQIAQSDRAAFDELYERYNRLVFGIALAILGERPSAEEVTLDVFVRVWQKAGTYRADRAKVSTWLIALTRHHAIDILRRQRSHLKTNSLNGYENSRPNPPAANELEEQVEITLEARRIREAFAQLPAEQREALVLAYFKGFTHSEIAEILKEPLGTIKTRIRLGMQKLRQMLEEPS